jgi:hypothetical protein
MAILVIGVSMEYQARFRDSPISRVFFASGKTASKEYGLALWEMAYIAMI